MNELFEVMMKCIIWNSPGLSNMKIEDGASFSRFQGILEANPRLVNYQSEEHNRTTLMMCATEQNATPAVKLLLNVPGGL